MPHFELLAPVRMNVVCFAWRGGENTPVAVNDFVARVRDGGETFVTPTCYRGRWGLRAAFSNWRTRESDLARIADALEKAAEVGN